VEEIVQALLDQGVLVRDDGGPPRLTRPVGDVEIPATVHDLLAARIDRLGEREKLVLQTAAVIGKEFDLPVLEQVVAGEPVAAALSELLHALTASEFLYETALYPHAAYAFKHPLTREVAYDSQLRARRARVHAAVARALAAGEAERLDERAGLVAHHFEAAGEALEAARWYARAAEWAGLNAPAEACRHWTRVRDLVAADAADAEAVELAFKARARLLAYSFRVGGISEEAAGRLFDEACTLADRMGTVRARFTVTASYMITLWMQGSSRRILELAREVLRVADASGADDLRCWALYSTGLIEWTLGDLSTALSRADEAVRLLASGVSDGVPAFGTQPLAMLHHHRGLYLIEAGRLDDARASLARGLEASRRLGATEQRAWCEAGLARVAAFAGDVETALRHARSAFEGVEKVGSSFGRVYVCWILGQVLACAGATAEATAQLTAAVDMVRTFGVGAFVESLALAELTDVRLEAGDLPGARAAVEEGVAALRGGNRAQVRLELARARLDRAEGDAAAADAALDRARAAVDATGARIYLPLVHLEQAELARCRGDDVARRRERAEAHRLLVEMGATTRAEQVGRDV
jgi:adenylate cyclase